MRYLSFQRPCSGGDTCVLSPAFTSRGATRGSFLPAGGARLVRGLLAGLGLLLLPLLSLGQTTTFSYTGAPQTYVVPAGITKLQVVATGATNGAVVRATVTVTPNETLTVLVGGSSGYNGGGTAATNSSYPAINGGGATDLRRTGASSGDYLSTRNALLVAGGGGGYGSDDNGRISGGGGGTPAGSNGGASVFVGSGGGGGATQTAPGTPGGSGSTGGNGYDIDGSYYSGGPLGGGGGGGYYGGGGGGGLGVLGGGGGGGGSSWVMPTGSSNISYASSSSGDGQLTLTPVPTATPVVSAPTSGSTVATTTPTYSGTAAAGSTVRLYVDGTLLGTTATATSGGTFSLTQPTALSVGSHTVYATAQASGLTVSASSTTVSFSVSASVLAPTISSFTPTTGAAGTSVAVSGSNLSSPTSVQVNGTAGTVLSTPAATATGFSFTVGAGSSSGALTLATAYGGATSVINPVLRLQATGGSGGDKTVYLDQVEILDGGGTVVSGAVSNGSFETGAPAGDLTSPGTAVSPWTFGGNARLSTTASAFGPPAPPDGTAHLALLQNGGGYLEQTLSLPAGTYQLRLQLAHRQYGGLPYDQAVQVMLNGVSLGAALTTTSAGYVQVVSLPFSVSTAGLFNLLPLLTGFTPPSGPLGTVLSLAGLHLTGLTSVLVGDAPAAFAVTSSTTATATVPRGATSQRVRVSSALGTALSPAAFSVTRPSSSPVFPAGVSLTTTGGGGVNVGIRSNPVVTDLDGDGLLDLLVGNSSGNVVRFEQTAANSSVFASLGNLTTNGSSVLSVGSQAAPAVTDLDGDGLLDLLVGNSSGNVVRFEQTTLNGTQFGQVGNLTTDGSAALYVGIWASPTVTDLDGDGLLDLLVGTVGSSMPRYEQTTANGSVFASQGNLTTNGSTVLNLGPADSFNPTITDVDGDGLLDLLVGAFNTRLRRFEQIAGGSGSFALVGNLAIGSTSGSISGAPTVTDLDGDGLLDILVGNTSGDVLRYEQADPPTTLALSPQAIAENAASGTVVGTFTTTTGTGQSTAFTYSLVTGTGSTDNASFAIGSGANAGQLVTDAVFDFETRSSYSVRVRTTDTDGLFTEQDFAISITDVLEAPIIAATGLSPTSGAAGSVISLTGTNLLGATAITFSGSGSNVVTTGFTVVNHTSITGIVVPAGARTGTLTVTTPGGTSAASAQSFTVCRPTAVGQNASLTLAAAGTGRVLASALDAGSTAACGGTLVATARKGGAAYGLVGENGTLTLTAPTGYTFTAVDFASYGNPSGSAGSYTLGNCHATSSQSVVEAAVLGRSGTVSIAATNTIFGGDPCGGTVKSLAVRAFYTRSSVLTGVSYGSVAESGTLTLTAPTGTVFTSVDFASYGNATGSAGSYVLGSCHATSSQSVVEAALLGKTGAVSITASNASFGDPCGGTVKNLSVRATYAVASPTLPFDCSELGAQPVLLTLTDASGTSATVGVSVTVSAPPTATLGTVSPSPATIGQTVTVSGTNLSGATALTVNGVSATLSSLTATGLSFVVPSGAAPTGSLVLSLPCGQSLSRAFSVTPALTDISPAAELPGQPVTLTGTGFTAGSTVSFSGVAATSVSYNSATSLTAVVPAGAAAGSSAVVVTTTVGSSASAPAFTVLGVLAGTSTSCASTVPYVATGDGAWHYLTTASGEVVAALQDTRAALGSVTVSYQATGSAGAVRQDGWGRRYLDRNFHLQASGGAFTGSVVNIRLYGLTSELARLHAVDNTTSYATLTATQYSGPNEDCDLSNDNFRTGDIRTLVTTASTPGGSVPWFVAQLAVADHFSEFYLTGSSTPLPVELSAFAAEQVGETVQLSWRTASEKHNDYFEVQRSLDGRLFAPLGQVKGQGSSASPSSYSYLDDHLTTSPPHQLTAYYRLRQVDLDGTASYSPVRTINFTHSLIHSFTAFPNPAHGAATVTGLAPGAPVEVLDLLGRPVASGQADAAGKTQLSWPAGLPAGVYLVRSGRQVLRLTVE